MAIQYDVTFRTTVTCDRCARSAKADEENPDTTKSAVVQSGHRWEYLMREAQEKIGAQGINLAGEQKVLCGECFRLLAAVAQPVAYREGRMEGDE